MKDSLVIALDIGTSSVRAIAFDSHGHKVGEAAQIPYDQVTTADGGVEIGADFLIDLTGQCLDLLLPKLKGEVAAVGISCFWHSLMAVNAKGKALTPVLSWADNRAAAYIPVLRSLMDEEKAHAKLGCVFHTSYWPAKLLHLRDVEPKLIDAKTKPHWMGFGEYLRLQWCGDARMSLSMASGTGLFDQNRCEFDKEIISHLPIEREQLPELCDHHDAASLSDALQKRWPALKDAKIFPTIGDGACSNIGSGCADDSKMGLNAGTSGAIRVVLPGFTGAAPRGLWRYRVDAKRSLVGGALSNAGNVITWGRETLNLPEDWQKNVGAMKPSEHGLTVLPFLAGERAPLWNGSARLVIEGAGWNTDAQTVMRALLEGAALRFAAIARELLQLAPEAHLVFSGGALEKVPLWQNIICDAIGAPLSPSLESEASARGAALLALEALGVFKDVKDAPSQLGKKVMPNAQNHKIYGDMLERQNALYSKVYE